MNKVFLEAGKILSLHGVRGELRIHSYCDSLSVLLNIKVFNLPDIPKSFLLVERSRPNNNVAIIKFKGIDNCEDALSLVGKIILTDRKNIKLSPNDYFIQDIIGMRVLDFDTKVEYGTITDVIKTGANDVYVIQSKTKQLLIPAIPEVVLNIDIKYSLMDIRPLKGLFENEN